MKIKLPAILRDPVQRTFCPPEYRDYVHRMIAAHYCAHELIPGYAAPNWEGIESGLETDVYVFHKIWSAGVMGVSMGELVSSARSVSKAIPVRKTTMIMERQQDTESFLTHPTSDLDDAPLDPDQDDDDWIDTGVTAADGSFDDWFDILLKADLGGPAVDVFVHGNFVYYIENGEIKDLGIAVIPPGKATPEIPFTVLSGSQPSTLAAVTVKEGSHGRNSAREACGRSTSLSVFLLGTSVADDLHP
ncbi:hypothetical protein HGRIS_001267 [Hohenbuehelia grisea]|uniref:Uncharacterized protein n=1 Tax=Hohenbuehelia grisea TaxID=104357 RepID=A0ABR3JPE7_9AGAR